ncbi:type II toxin-antitoxin system VapC family toxin|uniref:type II toxin-antitoxin system VapC family toxin n=1 Tax=Noviherbaspirillum sp. L7-7A TaxID=2850560 RepID=UPI001C2C418B|nr:type II toxin-antitoxin system VapC family toxin [Noviherbaspirillum sp. L7-7A]MBV0880440.1 type II toxin-antitoxin system VapC family toxin [Noviherbaspirillum sp. L7-7A]
MVSALFDTNILIDFLNGIEAAREEIALYDDKAISLITWMEVMVGAGKDAGRIKTFLSGFRLVAIDSDVAAEAVRIRQGRKIKLPDAIILACARTSHRLLITRNTRDFPSGVEGEVRTPYVLGKS